MRGSRPPARSCCARRSFGAPVRITTELLRVSLAIAALSALYFAVTLLTDADNRARFLGELIGGLEQTFTARTEYLALLAAGAAARPQRRTSRT